MEIIFNTGKYKRKITKKPRINTNEGPPGKNVQISAYIVERPDSTYPVSIKPYKLDLTQFGEKVRDQVKFRITNVSDKSVNTSMIATSSEYFEVDLPSSVGPGESAEGVLKLKEFALDKEFEKSFTFDLDDAPKTRFTVPVRRKLRPSVQQARDAQKNVDLRGDKKGDG
ncbi:MAG: hypothetical protein JSU74_11700 [Candidatus Zixiibacteriota bacterium]|nr:MAG: hypothetical protein JSU74_11700 [candidate division Zixibacteria bacterium]